LDEFRKEDCLEYVIDPTKDPQLQIILNDGELAMEEIKFNDPEPTIDVDTLRQDYLATSNEIHEEIMVNIEGAELEPGQKTLELLKAHNSRTERNSKCDERIAEMVKSFKQDKATWLGRKKDHERKVASTVKVFLNTLGPAAMAAIRSDELFTAGNFRECWRYLNNTYSVNQGGNKSKAVLLEMIQNAIFDGRSLTEHVEYMTGLMIDAETVGFPLSEEMKGQFVINSIRKAGISRYGDALRFHEEANTSWNEVFTRLQEVDSQHEIEAAKRRYGGVGPVTW
jgi:hypothetical protein